MVDQRLTLETLERWYDLHNTPCRYDHHGYCQEHFLESKGECIVEVTRAVLAEAGVIPDD